MPLFLEIVNDQALIIIVPCCEEQKARAEYDTTARGKCVFISSVDDIAFVLDNAEPITSGLLDTFEDVIITADAFSWTYCKTHEEILGPYYYKRSADTNF